MNANRMQTIEQTGATGTRRMPRRAARGRVFAAVAALMGVVMLGGCVTDGSTGMKQGAGTLLGAGLGGLVGSKFGGGRGQLAAVAAGALLGGFMGNEVGASLDRADQMYQQRAQTTALQKADWQPVAWSNPDSGNSGTITPVRTIQNTNTGELCREYQTSVTIGGRVEQGYGTACRTADGAWRISS